MVALAKLEALITGARASVRVMQVAADTLRGDGDMARAGMLEAAATSMARALHLVGNPLEANRVPENLASLLSIAGKSMRAMQSVQEALFMHDQISEEIEATAVTLSSALHEASEQTIPISVRDVLGDK